MIAIWACAVVIIFLSLWFGFSDLLRPWNPNYATRNPLRPVFRLAFGLLMTMITLLGAGLASRRAMAE
jgi:hypothetical protein